MGELWQSVESPPPGPPRGSKKQESSLCSHLPQGDQEVMAEMPHDVDVAEAEQGKSLREGSSLVFLTRGISSWQLG